MHDEVCYFPAAVRVPTRQSMAASNQSRQKKPQSAAAAVRIQTPFDRRKAQEVAKLNKAVEASLVQQIEQTNHLKAFRRSVVEQELEVSQESIRSVSEIFVRIDQYCQYQYSVMMGLGWLQSADSSIRDPVQDHW